MTTEKAGAFDLPGADVRLSTADAGGIELQAKFGAVQRQPTHLDGGDVGVVLTAERPVAKLARIELVQGELQGWVHSFTR
jgi:hypothetical protein